MSPSIITNSQSVNAEIYGRKAYWLAWLQHNGFNVPNAILLPGFASSAEVAVHLTEAIEDLRVHLQPFLQNGLYDVAVRSSATCEDTYDVSRAGHFLSVLGEMTLPDVLSNIAAVVDSLSCLGDDTQGAKMGVIIQQRIAARFSGVVFSSDPVTASKSSGIISVVPGMGMSLVSGERSGVDIAVNLYDTTATFSGTVEGLPEVYLKQVWDTALSIQNQLGHPVDIEWCIDDKFDLYVLQCRPITGRIFQRAASVRVSQASSSLLVPASLSHAKVQVRLRAENSGVMISPAYVVTLSSYYSEIECPDIATWTPSSECSAYSVVLIRPARHGGRIVRSFVGRGDRNILGSVELDAGQIVSRPDYPSVRQCLMSLAQYSSAAYWTQDFIVQEIYDPAYSGVVKRLYNGYVIEFALGHFVPKGAVATSQYLMNHELVIMNRDIATQDIMYRIKDGYVIQVIVDDSHRRVSLPDFAVVDIVQTLMPFLEDEKTVAEFGVLCEPGNGAYVPYLIDFAHDTAETALSVDAVVDGIVSPGVFSGTVVNVDLDEFASKSLDMHLLDAVPGSQDVENTVYCAPRPDISLLRLVQRSARGSIGFIFEEGSMLCHLAIVLRESGIPALIAGKDVTLANGTHVTIDASTRDVARSERVHVHIEGGESE